MMGIIKRIPIGMSGLALAFASLGMNLESALAHTGDLAAVVKTGCGMLAVLILAAVIARIATDRAAVRKEYRTVVSWTVTPTIFMTAELLAVYLKPLSETGALVLWAVALSLQLVWVIVFVWRFVLRFKIEDVYPSWFIVFVGFVVGATTSGAFGAARIGVVLLFGGLVGYLVILPLVLYRFFIIRGIAKPLEPLAGIVLAPANLCLAGYLALVGAGALGVSWRLIGALLVCSALSFVFYLWVCVPRMWGDFSPTFSAFTFPLVITSVAITQLSKTLLEGLTPIASVLQVSATVVVFFVLVRYLIFLRGSRARHANA